MSGMTTSVLNPNEHYHAVQARYFGNFVNRIALRGGVSPATSDLQSTAELSQFCSSNSIISACILSIRTELNQVDELFAKLEAAQRNFYDPARFSSWSDSEEEYNSASKVLSDKIDGFSQLISCYNDNLGDSSIGFSEAMTRLSALLSAR